MAAPPRLHIQLCGRLSVEADGERIESRLPGGLGRLLLAYLVLNRDRAIPREELEEFLWGDEPRSGDQLSPLVSRLRKALGGARIEGRRDLRFVDAGETFVDADWATEALHRAEAHASLGEWPRVWSLGHNAYHIAKRPFLLGFESNWADDWRRRLDAVKIRGLELFAMSGLGLGTTALGPAERSARELVDLAPFRETGHRVLMEVLEVQGNKAEALLVYERLREVLRDELGVDPSPAVQDVYVRLLG